MSHVHQIVPCPDVRRGHQTSFYMRQTPRGHWTRSSHVRQIRTWDPIAPCASDAWTWDIGHRT
eukprot:159762-Rhodomonas_salina.1